MENLEYASNYWKDHEKKNAFMLFIKKIFGLDLNSWDHHGLWDNRLYQPHSFFDESGAIISSLCIYTMEAVINGKRQNMFQLSGVGTLPEYRQRGFNRKLASLAFNDLGSDENNLFLFSSNEAIKYYQMMNFLKVQEYKEIMTTPITPFNPNKIKQLSIHDTQDIDKIKSYCLSRQPISSKFGVYNTSLLGFHVINSLKNHLYEIQDLNCIIAFKREGNRLQILDIIASNIPIFKDFYPYIGNENDNTIEFYFFTDKIKPGRTTLCSIEGNNPMIRSGINHWDNIVFPYTSKA